MWVAVKRVGLAPMDVLLVYAVGAYAVQQQRWNRDRGGLLGETGESEPPMRWGDFVCEHHQLLSCVVKGRGRSRQENFLAVATSTLAMLYWKMFFRSRLRMASLQALKESLWTLLVSKAVQQVIKRLIRLLARRTAKEHAQSSWLEVLHLQWRAMQSLAIGAMWLCVMLFLLEGARPPPRTRVRVCARVCVHAHVCACARASARARVEARLPSPPPRRAAVCARPVVDQADVEMAGPDGLLLCRGRRRCRLPPL